MYSSKKEYTYKMRSEFERNFSILAEVIGKDQIKFSVQSKQSIESLRRIRKLPNGRIDLNTINELARSTALMAANFEKMKKTKI